MTAQLQIPDLSSYETFVNGFPHDAFVQLREHAPVWWHEPTDRTPDGEGFWCVSTHELVVEVFRTPRVYSSHTGGDRPHGGTMINDMEMSGKLLNMMDDPRHQRIRQLVSKGFTPKRITRLRADLEAITGSTLDSVAPEPGRRGSCDLVTDVAAELPLQAICLLLGAPGEDRHALCEWVDVTSSDFSDEIPSSVRAEASKNLFQYGQRLIRDRTADPRDDLLSVVIHGELPDQDPPRLNQGTEGGGLDRRGRRWRSRPPLGDSDMSASASRRLGWAVTLCEERSQHAAERRQPRCGASASIALVRGTAGTIGMTGEGGCLERLTTSCLRPAGGTCSMTRCSTPCARPAATMPGSVVSWEWITSISTARLDPSARQCAAPSRTSSRCQASVWLAWFPVMTPRSVLPSWRRSTRCWPRRSGAPTCPAARSKPN